MHHSVLENGNQPPDSFRQLFSYRLLKVVAKAMNRIAEKNTKNTMKQHTKSDSGREYRRRRNGIFGSL